MADSDDETTHNGLWIAILTIIASISFWVQAKLTEERFVPALNVIANHFCIPDDIAGATLMAAGASSPELFSSFTALFITHSSLGLGTIVGSEIFNQLIICAGAVFATRSKALKLEPKVVTREVAFYLLSILLLYYALRDTRPDPDDPNGLNHIYISFTDASILFAGYMLYVYVCANMDSVVALFSKAEKDSQWNDQQSYGTVKKVNLADVGNPDGRMPFLREASLTKEPAGNFETAQLMRTKTGELNPNMPPTAMSEREGRNPASLEAAKLLGKFSDGLSLRQMDFLVQEEKPSDEHGLYDLEANTFNGTLSCFMWQRSYFYNKARFAIRGWHLRWFSFTPEKMQSVPDRGNAERHRTTYPNFKQIEIDVHRLIIRIINPIEGRRNFYLLAPSKEIFDAVLVKLQEIMEYHEDDETVEEDETTPDDDFEGEAGESLIEYHDDDMFGLFMFFFLYPFRLLMHWTIPDVRVLDPKGNVASKLSLAYLAVISCLLWLIVGSYAMVASLEALADILNISNAVVGVTVSAAGTSLPNYVGSKVAAEKGFGVPQLRLE